MPPPRAKVPPYLLLLVVSFALLGLIGYQTLKNRAVSVDLLKEKDSTIRKLEERLLKEEKRISELQKRLAKLSSQKDELNGMREGLSGQLIELGRVKSVTEDEKRKLESTLKAKEEEIKDLKDKVALFDDKEEELKLMKAEIGQKDAEIVDLKAQLKAADGTSLVQNQGSSLDSTEQASKTHEESQPAMHYTNLEDKVSEKVRVAAEEKDKDNDLQNEVDHSKDGMDSLKPWQESKQGDGSRDGEQMQEVDSSGKPQKAGNLDITDEESLVDDREEKAHEEEEPEADDARKAHEEEEEEEADDVDKAHEEEVADDAKKGQEEEDVDDVVGKTHGEEEQGDIDLEVLNKADLEENEMAAVA